MVKLNTSKGMSLSHTTVRKKLPHRGTTLLKIAHQNTGLYTKYLKKFQNNANIPPLVGESVFPEQEMSLNSFYDFSKYHIANILAKINEQ